MKITRGLFYVVSAFHLLGDHGVHGKGLRYYPPLLGDEEETVDASASNETHTSSTTTNNDDTKPVIQAFPMVPPRQEDMMMRHLLSSTAGAWCCSSDENATPTSTILCRLELMDMEMMHNEDAEITIPGDDEDGENDDEEDEQEAQEQYVCQVWEDDEVLGHYDVDLGSFPHILQAYQNSTNSGDGLEDCFAIQISGACVDEHHATIILSSKSKMVPVGCQALPLPGLSSRRHLQEPQRHRHAKNHRHLASASGTHTVVVIRVVYNNLEPALSSSQLRGRILGQGPDAVSVTPRTQLQACSGRQFRMNAFRGRNINGGLLEVELPALDYGDRPVRQLENAVMARARQLVGKEIKYADHVMIVLPEVRTVIPGKDFLAYGYLFGSISVFNNVWGGFYSALAHELGHNFGLHHSARGKYEYKDTSGVMGYSKRQISGPKTCFNAQKNYLLGWYDSRTRRLDSADLPWTGKLAFFGDYLLTDMDEPVLIHLSRPGNRLFIQYNRAYGINSGTQLKPDRVVIVKDKGIPGDKRGIPSTYRGALPIGGKGYFRIPNYVKPFDLVIHVCGRTNLNRPPYLRMSIYIDDGIQKPSCNDLPLPQYCDDNMVVKFYVDSATGYKDCAWLKQNLETHGSKLCHIVHPARNYCAETCGKCTDSCEDSEGTFYVNEQLGNQDCTWLSYHHNWQDRLCHSGSKAFDLCHESCDRCD